MSPTRSPRHAHARVQDLAEAILAGGETEELLDLVVSTARHDLKASSAALILPLGDEGWSYELVLGPLAPHVLGENVDPASPLGKALAAADPDAIESLSRIDDGPEAVSGQRALMATVGGVEHGYGVLAVLRPAGEEENGSSPEPDPADAAGPAPFSLADRERLDAMAGLIALALRLPDLGAVDRDLEDERSRIARDLHDLAIQELFAVGMELESLRDALTRGDELPSNARIRASVSTSVNGVENAVAQIRQIVQSLRRERSEATFTERLRHEVGLATAGLGFVPALRLPENSAQLDTEVPDEIAEDAVAVVRECLANAARHAHATAVACAISLVSEGVDRVVQVNVSDNGRGIDPSVTRRSGLANMSSRARRHNGWVDTFNLEPGTMISWRVTLPPQ